MVKTTPHTWDSLPVSVEHDTEHSRKGVPLDVETFIIRFHPLDGGAISESEGDFLGVVLNLSARGGSGW